MKNLMRAAGRRARAAALGLHQPTWVQPGHYYSPLAGPRDVQRALQWDAEAPGVDLRADEQRGLFTQLLPMLDHRSVRYSPENNMFGSADAAVYQAMLRLLRPARVLEVGSGYSTACLLDAAEAHGIDVDITCVEPYPNRLHQLLRAGDAVQLVQSPVQDVSLQLFLSLRDGDLLFIDSTHVAKAGSDVVWMLLHVLPRLQAGVHVYVHDIFWPFEYPAEWLREGRNWSENYLLHAFLVHNEQWEITLFTHWLWATGGDLVPAGLRGQEPAGFWMRRLKSEDS